MSYDNMTVAQLRAEINGHPRVVNGDRPLPGLSKMRKSALVEILHELNEVQDAPLHEQPMPGSPAAVAQSEEIAVLPEDWLDGLTLNERLAEDDAEAVVRGEIPTPDDRGQHQDAELVSFLRTVVNAPNTYLGKRVMVQIGTKRDKVTGDEFPNDIVGTVVDNVTRDSTMGSLLFAIRHEGFARVTLHRAEDAVLV